MAAASDVLHPESFDDLRRCEVAFENWITSKKNNWDKDLVGHVVSAGQSAIQHGDSGPTKPQELCTLQHEATSPQSTSDLFLNSSSRLEFLNLFTISPFTPSPSLSNSSNSASFSTSYSSSSSNVSLNNTPEQPFFTTEFFEVRKSSKGGLGAFATKDIPVNSVILSEKPLFKAKTLDVFYEYEKLSREQRREFDSLYYWSGICSNPVLARFDTNRFAVNRYTGGIFIKSSRFNHACREFRNCSYTYQENEDQLIITSRLPITNGQEITIMYDPCAEGLLRNYGFRCDCPACPDPETAKRHEELMRGTEPLI